MNGDFALAVGKQNQTEHPKEFQQVGLVTCDNCGAQFSIRRVTRQNLRSKSSFTVEALSTPGAPLLAGFGKGRVTAAHVRPQ